MQGECPATTEPSPTTAVQVVVCLPTYNEAGHITRFIAAIRTLLPSAQILVIDDSSPDGTGRLVHAMACMDDHVHLLSRPCKTGLGDAYRAGFAHAFKTWNPNLVVQMDADFSHPIGVLPALLAQALGSHLVIGSRYVALGGVLQWGRWRRLISRVGGAYARLCLALPISDPTSGLRVWHADLLKQVLSFGVHSQGYAFQIETVLIAQRLGSDIAEVPFLFDQRASGLSKMSLAIAVEAFWRIPRLRWTLVSMRKPPLGVQTVRNPIAR